MNDSGNYTGVGVGGQFGVDKSGGDTFGASGGYAGAGSITKGGTGVGVGYGPGGSGSGTGGNVIGGYDGSNAASVAGGNVTGTGGAGGTDQTNVGDITINT